jgi:hypothetical protein
MAGLAGEVDQRAHFVVGCIGAADDDADAGIGYGYRARFGLANAEEQLELGVGLSEMCSDGMFNVGGEAANRFEDGDGVAGTGRETCSTSSETGGDGDQPVESGESRRRRAGARSLHTASRATPHATHPKVQPEADSAGTPTETRHPTTLQIAEVVSRHLLNTASAFERFCSDSLPSAAIRRSCVANLTRRSSSNLSVASIAEA